MYLTQTLITYNENFAFNNPIITSDNMMKVQKEKSFFFSFSIEIF